MTRHAIALAVIAGLALRLALLIGSGWRYDYDEGMAGLQALHILDGERPVFHPGQPYLGAAESYLLAGLFALFGPGAVTLKLAPWLLAGVYIALTGWLGARIFGPRAGALSGLLAALAPAYLLVTGLKTWGATAETLALGSLLLVLTTYVTDSACPDHQRARALVALGLTGGLAFWISWLIAFYAVPVAIVLLIYARGPLRRSGWAAALAFIGGSLPFWTYNLAHGGATFRYLLSSQGDTWGNAWAVLDHLSYDLAPRLVSGDPAWRVLSWPATWWLQIVYQGALVGLIALAWRGRGTPGQPGRALLALFALLLPAIYVLSGYGNHALNAHGFDATGRYVLMAHSVFPVGVAAIAARLARSARLGRAVAAAILSSVMALNLLGAARLDPVTDWTSPYYTRQPATLDPLIAFLDAHGIRHVWTDVGVAHVLMFETQERILAADWYDIYGARGIVRFPDAPLAIATAERVAFVEVILPGQTDTPFERAFDRLGAQYTAARPSPDLLVIVPARPVDPALLGDGIGYQF
ncbi:MAG: glycosyltransferase family 39 protein [Chloroflexota bacterium]